jgi:hypothetical protein
MTNDELVEKVARAMASSEGGDPDKVIGLDGRKLWQEYSVLARAAIEASGLSRMREALESAAIMVTERTPSKSEMIAHCRELLAIWDTAPVGEISQREHSAYQELMGLGPRLARILVDGE